jgi:hypothetical protein
LVPETVEPLAVATLTGMNQKPGAIDPVAILDSLSSADIVRRLDDLAKEEKALRTLLRAARAREQARPRPLHTRRRVHRV